MTARLCRRSERSFSLFFGMRQRRQLGERRAKATMVFRLSAKPSGHWEKLSRRAIFPNAWPLAAVADESGLSSLCQDRTFFVKTNAQLTEISAIS